jgi:hypothetical protein
VVVTHDDNACIREVRSATLINACDPIASGNPDTDGDGIADVCDQDDDNDGITDEDEGCPSSSIGFDPKLAILTQDTDGKVFTIDLLTGSNTLVATMGYDINAIAFNELTYKLWVCARNSVNTTSQSFEIIDPATWTVIDSFTINTTASINGYNAAAFNPSNNTYIAFRQGTEYIVIDADPNSPTYKQMLSEGTVSSPLVVADVVFNPADDTDGDGIPDYLDLDSDNDGCVDAVEGAASYTETDLVASSGDLTTQNPNINLGTNVNTDGIPIGAGLPQAGAFWRVATQLEVLTPIADFTADTLGQSAAFSISTRASNNTSWTEGVPDYDSLGNANSKTRYQWYLGDPDSSGVALVNDSNYSGVTTDSLVIQNVDGLIENLYYVLVTNTDNECISVKQSALLLSLLPVELLYFKAATENCQVTLQWETASEFNNRQFVVYRSSNAINWQEIGVVAGNGTTPTPKLYSFTDNSAPGTMLYYRLKQTDFDGASEWLPVASADLSACQANGRLKIYPNPAKSIVRIEVPYAGSERRQLTIYNAAGAIVQQEDITGQVLKEVSVQSLASGMYLFSIADQSGVINEKIEILK